MPQEIEQIQLILANSENNNNKVWYGILCDNGDVITRWGRVGYALQSKTFPGRGRSFLLKKVEEKREKGYSDLNVVSNAVPASVKNLHKSELDSIARTQLIKSASNPVLDKLVTQLVAANVHQITSTTNLRYNESTGLFSTPLGIVDIATINKARVLLDDIAVYVQNGQYDVEMGRAVSNYIRLIPQNIGMKFDVRRIFPNTDSVAKQNDILDSLAASYAAVINTPPAATDSSNPLAERVFKVDLDVLSDTNVITRLERWFETSKKTMHGYDRVKIRNVFSVTIHDMNDAFNGRLGNVVEVFHGTSQANCLSILKSGLRVSPPSTAAIAGKMFGNGIYGAVNSSKSLGYTYGRWGQSVGDSGWLFVCDFAMGKTYTTDRACQKPTGYDSIWAKAGRGLYHDELIVYQNNQVNIKYLLECK